MLKVISMATYSGDTHLSAHVRVFLSMLFVVKLRSLVFVYDFMKVRLVMT